MHSSWRRWRRQQLPRDEQRIIATGHIRSDAGSFPVAAGTQVDRLTVRNADLITIGQLHRIIEHVRGATTAATDDARAPHRLQRVRDELGRRAGAAVDQHHPRLQVGRQAGRRQPDRGAPPALLQRLYLGDSRLQQGTHQQVRAAIITAAVLAQVQHQALELATGLLLQLLHVLLEVRTGGCARWSRGWSGG
ncbi:hypothetical protein G6F66_014134 [Rhizopus arrhizus]|nr:hypothetical protein G6F66_014134 [Rhizopus arrhizus]